MSSDEIFNLYRSLYGFKNVLTYFTGELTKIIEISKVNENVDEIDSTPGAVYYSKRLKKLLVKCSDGKLLEIIKVNLVSKKKIMSGSDFKNGFLKNYEKNVGYFNS